MKKLIYQILVIALVLSSIGIIPVVAAGHLHQAAVDFVVSEGLWTAGGDFVPDEPATRAQTASVIARFLSDLRPPYAVNFSDVDDSNHYAGDITLASNLGLISGSDGIFRPNDAITREEFAVMLVRAYEIAGEKINDVNYLTELIRDYESISDWAKSSVTKALGNGIMISGMKKRFNPSESVTRAELATAVYALYLSGNFAPAYTEEIVSAPDLTGFTLLNTYCYVKRGIGGFGVIARYDGGPGQIYVKRDKVPFKAGQNSGNNQEDPMCFVKVTDPNGNVICRVDIDWLESGVMEKIINIPEGPAGIYQIQINNGNMNTHFIYRENAIDKFTVGIKGEKSWGFRGEDAIMIVDDSLPHEGYIYVPEKVDFLTMGIAGGGANGMGDGTTFTLYSEDGSTQMASLNTNYYGVDGSEKNTTLYADPRQNEEGVPAIVGGKAYQYKLVAENQSAMKVRLGFTGITPIIYPNKEYALDLMSGYIQHTDEYASLQLKGPLQKRARERMVEIYNEMDGDFTVDISETKPTAIPDDVDNVQAEAQLFGAYHGSLTNVKGLIDTQCMDPENPWFGAIISRNQVPYDVDGDGTIESGETVYPEWTGELKPEDYPFYKADAVTTRDWQTDRYKISGNEPFSGPVSINSELNPYYNHTALVKRAELVLLHLATQASADGLYVYSSNVGDALGDLHEYEQFFWGDHGLAQAYWFIRPFLSPETRQITDASMLNETDRLMNFRGKGPSNQLIMAMTATAWTYAWSGMEIYHEQLKRQVMGMTAPAVNDEYHGQAKLGYFIESGGADGSSYGKMCEGLWGSLVQIYLSLPESMQDPQLKADIIAAEELYLKWDSYFTMPSTKNFAYVGPTNWTSRVNLDMGPSPVDGNRYMKNIFPRAKKNLLVAVYGKDYKNYESLTSRPSRNAFIVTDAQAKNVITYYNALPKIDKYYYTPASCSVTDGTCLHYEDKGLGHGGLPEEYRASNSPTYFTFHEDQLFDDSQMPTLPFELSGDNNILVDENGIVAVKHKGIYLLGYFNNSMPGTKMSNYSWMGGGPTTIWDDYFANTLNPRKPVDYTKMSGGETTSNYTSNFTADKMRHSCIIGTAANGKLFVSGREKASFAWIESGKSFQLSGSSSVKTDNGVTIHDKTVTWKYYLTDNGISIDAGVENFENGDDFYMQLPILVQKGATYTFDEENHQIAIEHGGNKIVYRWKADAVVNLGAASSKADVKETYTTTANEYKYLRIKLTENAPFTTVWIERTLAS